MCVCVCYVIVRTVSTTQSRHFERVRMTLIIHFYIPGPMYLRLQCAAGKRARLCSVRYFTVFMTGAPEPLLCAPSMQHHLVFF